MPKTSWSTAVDIFFDLSDGTRRFFRPCPSQSFKSGAPERQASPASAWQLHRGPTLPASDSAANGAHPAQRRPPGTESGPTKRWREVTGELRCSVWMGWKRLDGLDPGLMWWLKKGYPVYPAMEQVTVWPSDPDPVPKSSEDAPCLVTCNDNVVAATPRLES